MPRMTNTTCWRANATRRNSGLGKNGIYAANFGGGQVDITSGKYVFRAPRLQIENGKPARP